jgi:alginate O-acetyltransferase complex protein AlgI
MVFSSNLFLFLFLPVTLALYYLIKNHRWQNSVLVFMSVLFYAWGAPHFLVIFFISLFVNYFLVQAMEKNSKQNIRKVLLFIAVAFNLSILLYFKYTNFLVLELGHFLTVIGFPTFGSPGIILPIGISFFTFHKISYAVDVYRNRKKGFTNLLDYNLYLLFFPQLIAGPIVRFHEIADQIRDRQHSIELFMEGIWRFSLGLCKKVVIADRLGNIASQVFSTSSGQLNITTAWVGIVCYAFQIFFDFSGYSDMAIGLGKLFGFNLPENFNQPYLSRSITEFWRRWHMSLSRFFKDYLYIPLGGNRVSKGRQYFNLWAVFLLCGFWHGANWTFLVWGIYHGLLLVIEKLFLLKILSKVPAFFSTAVTFILVLFGWVFFRSPDLPYAFHYLKTLFTVSPSLTLINTINFNILNLLTLFIAVTACFIPGIVNIFKWNRMPVYKGFTSIALLLFSIIIMSGGSFSPFIYYHF